MYIVTALLESIKGWYYQIIILLDYYGYKVNQLTCMQHDITNNHDEVSIMLKYCSTLKW